MNAEAAIRCIVVDDEPISRNIIQKFINKTNFLTLVDAFEDAASALPCVLQNSADLLFLDVEMPEMSGIDLIKSISHKAQVILITSQKDYALEAYELDVVDYILKPLTYPRFIKAVLKIKDGFQGEATMASGVRDEIFVKHNARYIRVPGSEILWIEAIGDYVEIHAAGKKYAVHTTMKAIEKKLPESAFIRVHRSYIVRLSSISEIEDNTLVVNKKLIPIGKSYKNNLLKSLNLL